MWEKIHFFCLSFGKDDYVAPDPVDDPEVVTVEPVAAVVDPAASSPLPGTPGINDRSENQFFQFFPALV